MPLTKEDLEGLISSLTTEDQLLAAMDLIVRMILLYNAGYPTFSDAKYRLYNYDYDQLPSLKDKSLKFEELLRKRGGEAKDKKQEAFTGYINTLINTIQVKNPKYLPSISEFKMLLGIEAEGDHFNVFKSILEPEKPVVKTTSQKFSAWTPFGNASARNTTKGVVAKPPPPPPAQPPRMATAAAGPPPAATRSAARPFARNGEFNCETPEIIAASLAAREFVRNPRKSPNLFPDANLSYLRTLGGLNRFIEERYRGRLGDEAARTRQSDRRTLGTYMNSYKEYRFSQYQTIESAGTNSDCLIHSFLTATCPAFRRLTSSDSRSGRDKNEFATWFRHYLYPSLPPVATRINNTSNDTYREGRHLLCLTTGEILKYRIFTPSEFLSDQDISLLCESYNTNIVVFEGQRGLQTVKVVGPDLIDPARPVYMISNASGAHFESVRTPEGSYTISGQDALHINRIVLEDMINDSFGGMTDVAAIRRGVSTFGINLPPAGTATTLKAAIRNSIEESKQYMRGPARRAANVGALVAAGAPTKEAAAAAGQAQKAANMDATNRATIEALIEAGASRRDAEAAVKRERNDMQRKQVEANAALARKLAAEWGAEGGSRRRSRSLRAKRRHTSKAHGRRRKQ